jgi:hypothetical protein
MTSYNADFNPGLKKSKAGLVIFLSLFLAVFLSTTAQAATTMKHTAPDYFVPDQRIRMEAQVEDPQGVKLVRCYFKAAGEADLVFVPMSMTGKNEYAGILPAPSAGTSQIEYLFLAVNSSNVVVRSQNFRVYKNATKEIPDWQEVPKQGEIKVSMELGKPPKELRGFSDNVTIDMAESGARFGVVALLYHAAADSSSKSAVAAAGSSTGATSGGTVAAGSAGWSTTTIVGVGVGAAVVVGGGIAAASGGGGGGGGGEAEELTATTILGDWKFSGERRDGVRRSGTTTVNDDGTHEYTVKDADGQSDGSGTGTWTLSGTSLTMTFPGTISTLSGTTSGNSRKFTLDTTLGSNHGVYNFTR